MTNNEAPENAMRRIQALLEMATHPGTPQEERENAQDKADALMRKYRLDRAMINFTRVSSEVRDPEVSEYDRINLIDENSFARMSSRDYREEWGIQFEVNSLRGDVYRHCGTKVANLFDKMTVVGYQEDIFFGDLLWTTIFQDLVKKMFPIWLESNTFDQNVFALKNAGFSWPQVREMGLERNAKDQTGLLTAKNAGSKLRTAYARECKRQGFVPPEIQPRNPGLWRRSFIDSYASRLRHRFIIARAANNGDVSPAGTLALVKEEDLLTNKLWELFPQLNPENQPPAEEAVKGKKRLPKLKTRAADESAWAAGYNAANSVNINNSRSAEQNKKAGIES